MLFVALLEAHPGTTQERTTRRVDWDYPEGVQIVAEYWLSTPNPEVISVFEADHVGQIWALFADWRDVFEITIYPAVTAEDGINMLKQTMQE